jgi:hypothetical protein
MRLSFLFSNPDHAPRLAFLAAGLGARFPAAARVVSVDLLVRRNAGQRKTPQRLMVRGRLRDLGFLRVHGLAREPSDVPANPHPGFSHPTG